MSEKCFEKLWKTRLPFHGTLCCVNLLINQTSNNTHNNTPTMMRVLLFALVIVSASVAVSAGFPLPRQKAPEFSASAVVGDKIDKVWSAIGPDAVWR